MGTRTSKMTRKECNPQIVGNGAIVELGESRNQVQEGERGLQNAGKIVSGMIETKCEI